MMLTFRVRACPTRQQHAWFAACLDHTRNLYNAALEERLGAWRKARKRITLGEQGKALTELRRDAEYAVFPRRMQRWTLDRVHVAYREHVKRLADPSKPREDIRFRGKAFWRTIGFDSPIDFEMHERGLYQRKALGGTLRLKRDRDLPPWENCKAITFTREDRRWFVNLTYEMPEPSLSPRLMPMVPVGLDLGLKTSVVRSDGAEIDAVGSLLAALPELRRLGRALARCKKRSRRRQKVKARLARLHARVARRRGARLHEISARLVRHWDAVAVEDLNLAGLMRSGDRRAQGRGMRRKWRDFSPGRLVSLIEWKCQREGRAFARVDPRGTSQECAGCGALVPKTLRDRVHRCDNCGIVLDRDHNAALNVLNRAGWGPGGANPGGKAGNPAGLVRDCPGNTAGDDPAGPRRGGLSTSLHLSARSRWNDAKRNSCIESDSYRKTVPRARGDEPGYGQCRPGGGDRSPRTRG
ncbi:MAG: transposase [Acidiphilium sp.]|jgi:putative transposase|nr:transposase [Acidiphilium sp.]